MTGPPCDRFTFDDLTDYAAGVLADDEAAALEEHLFTCAGCARLASEVEALASGIGTAVRSARIGGFVTDDVLNRLARDGVRVRSFALSPGAAVPCAVWEDDELMVLRLRGDFKRGGDITISRRDAGVEVNRTTGYVAATNGEVLYATPAARIRGLPATRIEFVLTTTEGGEEQPIGTYTLLHGGALHR